MENFQQGSQRPLNVELDSDEKVEQLVETLEERAMRFELLSAYIDGEVTADERRQVQQWLDSDPKLQKLYTQLLKLQQDIKQIPVPTEFQSTQQLKEKVFEKIDRRKSQKLVLVGGALLSLLFIGFASEWLPGQNSPLSQIAHQEAESEPLMIALNQPIVEIPVAEKPKK